ncbi:MAG: hypothetical protein HLUCCA08_02005 [Rhodobacteraceae bacterium HLUCCA08]|nr:MAG: hypothetical protein HLUCCA08_02005 [Rhodobacteraceae bacterium HLUCCA08]
MVRWIALALCLSLTACTAPGAPPGVRSTAPAFLFCTPEGVSPLAATLTGRPLEDAQPYVDTARAAGIVIDRPRIDPDGTTSAILIETPDLWSIRHRDGLITNIGCIPRDLCTGALRDASKLCRGSPIR